MSVIFLVLPLAVLFSIAAVGVFLWAARQGQFDDLQTPALRILHDDVPPGQRSGAPHPAPTRTTSTEVGAARRQR